MNREELRAHLQGLRKQISETQKLLDSFEYEERLNESKKYVGRYFKEKNNHHGSREYVRCLFVYGLNNESTENNSLLVSYWKDESCYFTIDYYGNFNPKNWEEEDEWLEITKEEFMEHYEQVQVRISAAIKIS